MQSQNTENDWWRMDDKKRFDTAIVFGYGPILPGPSNLGKLNVYGRINALAAGMIYLGGKVDIIIPTGGKTGGSDRPSEARLTADIISSRFDIPERVFILEEKATNTILNVVYAANIIDRSIGQYSNLLFIAMGFHRARIKEICSLVRLEGDFVAAETVVSTRSMRHYRLLSDLLQPEKESYAKILAEQQKWLRELKEVPEYWLPQMAMIENPSRLRQILKTERLQPFLYSQGVENIDTKSIDDLYAWLHSIPRKLAV